ncbi:MAG: hypothetical protein AAGU04_09130, partial [Anaerolineaceae bacterium]
AASPKVKAKDSQACDYKKKGRLPRFARNDERMEETLFRPAGTFPLGKAGRQSSARGRLIPR